VTDLKTFKKVSPKTKILRNDTCNKRYFIKFVSRSIALDRRLLTVYFLANHLCNCQSFVFHPFNCMGMRHERGFVLRYGFINTLKLLLTVKNLPSYITPLVCVCLLSVKPFSTSNFLLSFLKRLLRFKNKAPPKNLTRRPSFALYFSCNENLSA
jgi:hypothetical protein